MFSKGIYYFDYIAFLSKEFWGFFTFVYIRIIVMRVLFITQNSIGFSKSMN